MLQLDVFLIGCSILVWLNRLGLLATGGSNLKRCYISLCLSGPISPSCWYPVCVCVCAVSDTNRQDGDAPYFYFSSSSFLDRFRAPARWTISTFFGPTVHSFSLLTAAHIYSSEKDDRPYLITFYWFGGQSLPFLLLLPPAPALLDEEKKSISNKASNVLFLILSFVCGFFPIPYWHVYGYVD